MSSAVPAQRSFTSPSWVRSLTALGGALLLCAGVLAGCLGIVGALVKDVARPGPTDPPEALTLTAAALSTALLAWVCRQRGPTSPRAADARGGATLGHVPARRRPRRCRHARLGRGRAVVGVGRRP